MKVLNISIDRNLFDEKSAVFERQKEYAQKLDELYIISFSLKKHKLVEKHLGNLHIYPTNSSNRIGFLFDAYRLGAKIIRQNLSSSQFVITTQDPMTIVGYVLSKRFDVPFQMQIHTDIYDKNFKNSLVTWKNFWYSGWVQVFLDRFLIPRANGIRVVGEGLKQSLVKKFPNLKVSIDVLPIFVDIEKIINSEPKDRMLFPEFDFKIVMVSRLTKEKRVDIALQAMGEVIKNYPRAGLVIVGDGQERSALLNITKSLGLSSNVIFIGWKDNVISFYKSADIFLLTSDYEGYGMSLLEAGASGLPIVTTSVGLAKTPFFQNGENSFVCSVGDSKCISEKILELISNPEKRELFKKRMQDSIRKQAMSKEEYVANYIGLLEKLCLKNI